MRVCIDIGGTKTLIAKVNEAGQVLEQVRFETPSSYADFLEAVRTHWQETPDIQGSVVVGAPGLVDRQAGKVVAFGNLSWTDIPLAADISAIINHPVYLENDANLAALGEYYALAEPPHQALYITVSTGIGTGIVTDGKLDPDHLDSEGGELLIEHNGQYIMWEKLASGSAIVAQYGQRASELEDEQAWQDVSERLAVGIINMLSILEPELIIIGGGVGTHFDKFSQPLQANLERLKPKLISIPTIVQATQPEEAVILGSFQLSKQLD